MSDFLYKSYRMLIVNDHLFMVSLFNIILTINNKREIKQVKTQKQNPKLYKISPAGGIRIWKHIFSFYMLFYG